MENTPLQVPKLVTAERGVQAIRDFFRHQKDNSMAKHGRAARDINSDEDVESEESKHDKSHELSMLLTKQSERSFLDGDK